MGKKLGAFYLFLGVLLLAACGENSSLQQTNQEQGGGKIVIVTTIAQIAEPLSVIGGDRVEVRSLMGPSVDPHLYNATHGDIQKVESSDLIFYNGLNLEANMVEVFNEIGKNKPVLAIGETIPEDKLLTDDRGAIDPHIWFDIDLWELALNSAVEEMKKYSPEDADYFEENKIKYFAELEQLKQDTKKLVEIPKSMRVLVTAHDAFGYFGRMHGIKVVGLQGLSTEDEVGVSDIQSTIHLLKEYQVPAVFVESSISPDTIQAVIEGAKGEGLDVELGGELFSDAMGEPGTTEGTYIGMYRHNVITIFEALNKGEE